MLLNCRRFKSHMARAITHAESAGALSLLLRLFTLDPVVPPYLSCPALDLGPVTWHLDLSSLAIGIFVGLLIFPVIEVLVAYRLALTRALANHLLTVARAPRSHYRVL